MAFDLITVAVFGHPDSAIGERIRLRQTLHGEADGFDVHAFAGDDDLARVLSEVVPHVIFTFGRLDGYGHLLAAPIDVRKRWVHFEHPDVDPGVLAETVLTVFADVSTRNRFPGEPLVSVFTPTYLTGDRILRPWRSLQAQTYTNWEWVVYDDSPGHETFEMLARLAAQEPRMRLFRADRPCGRIGEVKRRCCGLARGTILAELDHDDELTDHCLGDVVEAFKAFPDAGFVYTDCAEIFEDGGAAIYGESFAFGFGSYRSELYRGERFTVMNYPSINAMTVRHIVGMPNHVRAWRRDAYEAIGGYGSEIHVADDYEICLRTFLATPMVHVQRFGYIQYLSRAGANTQRTRNAEIQRLVRVFRDRYGPEIHDRFAALGVEDFLWRDGAVDWSVPAPRPTPIANYVLR